MRNDYNQLYYSNYSRKRELEQMRILYNVLLWVLGFFTVNTVLYQLALYL